jgi:serine protease Do
VPDNIPVDSKNSIVKSNITFSNLTNELRRKLVIKDKVQGIIVTSIMKSERSYGFKVGDLIIDVNKQQIESVEQLNELYEDAKNAKKQNIILLAKRRGISLFIPLPVID